MAQIRIWSWSKMPSRPKLAALLREYFGTSIKAAAEQAESLSGGGVIDVGRLEARQLAPLKDELSALGANAEIEL
jgi:hypothetical protein